MAIQGTAKHAVASPTVTFPILDPCLPSHDTPRGPNHDERWQTPFHGNATDPFIPLKAPP